ncbi:testin [Brachionichthys hirsutus]|uniref:testin n=1 Tax=Brachionichthys hirsutus TaxID=412623 RepID=UPI0036043FF4
MEMEKEVKKMTLGHEFGAGAACLKCQDKCDGFELHFWRKICRNCKCGLSEHNVQMNSEENKKVGKLFEDTKYTGLVAKLRKDGVPSYKGNVITVTLPGPATAYLLPSSAASAVVPPSARAGSVQPGGAAAVGTAPVPAAPASATPVKAIKVPLAVGITSTTAEPLPKDAPMRSVTYEWAPPVANKHTAVRYIELLPPEKRPIAGTEGAAYRRRQMDRQLPEHDQDPSKCHELSPAEVKQMQQYVHKCKSEALGVGDVLLPEDMVLVQAGGLPGNGVGAGGTPEAEAKVRPSGAGPPAGPGVGQSGGDMGTTTTAGALGVPGGQQAGQLLQNFSCRHCQQPMRLGEPAVYAERAGYDKLWHPACFVCCTCSELLVDMIYFWKKGKLYCGRHYGDSEKPRCGGCDELIFSNEYTQAEGQNWHLKHFCCFDCDRVLAGETYVMENDKPVCKPCYMRSYAMCCSACQAAVEPEAQRVSYGEHHWHAEPRCFKCSGCSKCLIGQRFMVVQGCLFCSAECKKKTVT